MNTRLALHDRAHPRPAAAFRRAGLGATIAGLLVAVSIARGATVNLAWDAPTNNLDGTPLTNLLGYKVYYGASSRSYTTVLDIGAATTASVANLPPGVTQFFAVTCYNALGSESDASAELASTPPPPSPLDHFAFGPVPSTQSAGVPIDVTVTALDTTNITVTAFVGSVSLSGWTNSAAAIGKGTSVSDTPMRTTYDDVRTQAIYLTNEVGRAGWISALSLNVSAAPGQTMKNWTLRLKHTALQKFTSASTWETNGWTTVYGKDLTVAVTGWVSFALATPFYYNGASNLMVDFSFNNTNHVSRAGNCPYTVVANNRKLSGQANGTTYGDPLNWSGTAPARSLSRALPNLRLQIGVPVAISPAHASGFVNGIWTGSVTVFDPATGMVLRVEDGAGHSGAGTAIDVIAAGAPPALGASQAPTLLGAPRPAGKGGTGIVVLWTSAAGAFYSIERSTNLMAAPAFATLALHVTGQDPTTEYADRTATGSGPYYYRVRVEP